MNDDPHADLTRSQAVASIYTALGKDIYYHGDKPPMHTGTTIRSASQVEHVHHFMEYDRESDTTVTYRYHTEVKVVVWREEVARRS